MFSSTLFITVRILDSWKLLKCWFNLEQTLIKWMAIIKLLYTTVNIHLSEIINALAASNGYANVVQFLLASGINPAIRSSDDGQTALDQATSDEIIKLLRAAELKQ